MKFSEEARRYIERATSLSKYYETKINSLCLLSALHDDDVFRGSIKEAIKFPYEYADDYLVMIRDELRRINYSEEDEEEEINEFERAISTLSQMGLFSSETTFPKATLNFYEILIYAAKVAEERNDEQIYLKDLIISFLLNVTGSAKKILEEICEDIHFLSFTYEKNIEIADKCKKQLVLSEELSSFVTILNEKFDKNPNCAILGRNAIINEIWKTMLKKTKRNVILIGDPGVGKSSIISKLTCDIINKKCPKEFEDFYILSLDVNSLVAGTTYRGDAERRYQYLIDLLQERDDVILFIDEVHMIVGAGDTSRDKNQDFSNALKPLLAGDSSRVIGATTDEEYRRAFGSHGALRRRFRNIIVKEPRSTEVHAMLKDSIKQLEEFHGVQISKSMVDYIILNSSCFNYETCNPDRTKDLIDLSMATAKMDGKTSVDKASVLKNFDVNIQKFKTINRKVLSATAYHEAGHYIMWRMSEKLIDREVVAVSVMPAQDYMGVNVFDYSDEYTDCDMEYFIDLIALSLAGRAAEELFANSYNSGAKSDLQKATKIAYDVITKYGMSEKFSTNRAYVDEGDYRYQTPTAIEHINEEVNTLIKKAYTRAKTVLNENYELIKELADTLCKKGILSKKELNKIVEKHTKIEDFV